MAAIRAAAGLTQVQLAQVLGTEQTRVSAWERGAMTPRPAIIPAIAAAVGMDALEFLSADPAAPALVDLRLAAGLSRQELADAVGISLDRFRSIELGASRREPPRELVESLARELAVPAVMIRAAIDIARQ